MDIVFCTDDNYVQHCAVTITSICENNKTEELRFHILIDKVEKTNKEKLEKLVYMYQKSIEFYYLDISILKDCPIKKGDHASLAAYFRILLPSILPDYLKKILYMDCDIVVENSLVSLWDIDITNSPVAAVYDSLVDDIRIYNRLMYDPNLGYFNSGVLLINLQYWRDNDISNKLLYFIKDYPERIKWWDQDALNSILIQEAVILPFKYNMTHIFFDDDPMIRKSFIEEVKQYLNNPYIIHYTTARKPWHKESTHPFRDRYFNYLELTPWKKYTPVFMNNSLSYKIVYYLKKIYHKLNKRNT